MEQNIQKNNQGNNAQSEVHLIKDINIEYQFPNLICNVETVDKNEEYQFAFYVYRNSEKIHTLWYQKENKIFFDIKNIHGYYNVSCFVKLKEKIEIRDSQSLYVNIKTIDFLSETDIHIENDSCVACYLQRQWKFPVLSFFSKSDKLFVLCPATVNRKIKQLPVFFRWSWVEKNIFPGNVLCFSDPTLELNEEMPLGWCLGTSENDATLDFVEILKSICREKHIPVEKMVFDGSSAGGFMALALATYFEGATAIAIKPQIDLLQYYNEKAVNLVRKYCFSGMTKESIRKKYASRVDMKERWKSVQKSKIILAQNILDEHHYEVHFKPFWKSIGGNVAMGISKAGRHTAWLYSQEGGHNVPETEEMVRKRISMLE